MVFRFVALVAALACVDFTAANPIAHAPYAHGLTAQGCPRPPLPAIEPVFVQSVIPAPVNIGPSAPGVIEHVSAPYELNYFEKPWVIKHLKSAALNVFTQTPVVIDEYAAPAFGEAPAPAAVVVEQVCGAPAAAVPGAGYPYAAGAGAYGAPYGAAPVVAPVAYGCH